MSANKKTTQRQGFKTNEFIVYPAHGVGQIIAIEEQEIAGREARAVRHQLHQGQDDVARSDRQDRVGRHAQAGRGAAGQEGARDAEGPRAHQAHHVVAPGAGIRSQDQFGRHRRHRRSGARPVPLGDPAGAVLLRTAALRSRARSSVARNRGGAEDHRDRSGQGNRGRALPRARAAVRPSRPKKARPRKASRTKRPKPLRSALAKSHHLKPGGNAGLFVWPRRKGYGATPSCFSIAAACGSFSSYARR